MSKISKLPVYTNQPAMTRLQDARVIQTEALAQDFMLAYMKSDQPVQGNAASQQILVNAGNNLLYKGTLISVDELQQLYTVLFYTGKQQEYNTPTIALAAGDRVRIAIEKNRLYYQPQATHHFFFGDETAIGVFNAFIEMALENDQEYFGVLECAQHGETALKKLNLLLDGVPYQPESPANNAIQWMEDMHPHCWNAWKNAQFYLAGNQQLIIPFSEYLASRDVTPLQMQMLDLS